MDNEKENQPNPKSSVIAATVIYLIVIGVMIPSIVTTSSTSGGGAVTSMLSAVGIILPTIVYIVSLIVITTKSTIKSQKIEDTSVNRQARSQVLDIIIGLAVATVVVAALFYLLLHI